MNMYQIIERDGSFWYNNNNYHIEAEEPEQGNGQACRYDGHCPIGMTCGVVAKHDDHTEMPGQCLFLPIVDKNNKETIDRSSHHHHDQDRLDSCVQACRTELEWDEHFFHGTQPRIVSHQATSSHSRPTGCILDFVRHWPEEESADENHNNTNEDDWKTVHAHDTMVPPNEPEPSIVAWEQHRFRHVVRVDPLRVTTTTGEVQATNETGKNSTDSTHSKDNDEPFKLWRAYCSAPCQSHRDCKTQSTMHPHSLWWNPDNDDDDELWKQPWLCVQGACQRNSKFWEPTTNLVLDPNVTIKTKDGGSATSHTTNETIRAILQQRRNQHQWNEMVIVTAATNPYFDGLRNLVASARFWAPNHAVVIYNLRGLNQPNETAEVLSWSNVIAMEWWDKGIPSHYPRHVHNGKQYAWKPLIIQETLKQYGMIFWLDAGSTLTGPITPVIDIVKRNGLFVVKGQDTSMQAKSHPETYRWFGLDKETFQGTQQPHFSGNTQAYLAPSRFVESIVECNAVCAWNESCIAPPGSTLRNHRYDQTSLSLCAYQAQAPHHTEYLAADQRSVASNILEEASYRFVWTARKKCRTCYISQTQNYLDRGIVPKNWTAMDPSTRIYRVGARQAHHVKVAIHGGNAPPLPRLRPQGVKIKTSNGQGESKPLEPHTLVSTTVPTKTVPATNVTNHTQDVMVDRNTSSVPKTLDARNSSTRKETMDEMVTTHPTETTQQSIEMPNFTSHSNH